MSLAQKKARILVVEDESIVALDMRSRLVSMGYEVAGLAATGLEAINLSREQRPDLALMDIKLKGDMDGVETAEAIRSERDIPIIFITAFADEGTLARAKVTQAFGYILKPFQEREVLISIEMALSKHQLEMELRQSREWLDGSLNAIGDGIIAVDGEDSIIFLNRAAETLLGISDTVARGQSLASVCSLIATANLTELGEQRRKERAGGEISWVMLESQTGKRPVELVQSSIAGRGGAKVLALRDITEIIGAEKVRSRLSAIVSNSHDAILAITPDLTIVSWNIGAELIYGYTESEVLGKKLLDFVPDEKDRTHLQSLVELSVKGTEIGRFDIVRKCRSGKLITVSISLFPVQNEEGLVHELACIERDVSAEKEYEASLIKAKMVAEEAARSKGEFLSNMSHELRTPLNSIIGMVELSRDLCVSAEQREFLEIARQSADGLLFLINSILDFSRIEAGKLKINAVPFDLVDTVADCIEGLSVQASRKGLDLFFHFAPASQTSLIGDPHRLEQILTNVLANAIKFTERGSVSVDLSTEREGDPEMVSLVLSVADTGIGMAPDKIDSIWDKFTQLDGSSTRAFGGTGLGLAIVKSLVELMAGRIAVESVEGKGSVFTFRIPFAVSQPAMSAAHRERSLDGAVVFVVSAAGEQQKILMELLSVWGCRALALPDAKSLLDHLKKLKAAPALVLIDEFLDDRQKLFAAKGKDDSLRWLEGRLVVISSVSDRKEPLWRTISENAGFLIRPVRSRRLLSLLLEGLPPVHGEDAKPAEISLEAQGNGETELHPEIGDDGQFLRECSSIAGVREILELFLGELSGAKPHLESRLELAASNARKKLDGLQAKASSRLLFKMVLASRREDSKNLDRWFSLLNECLERDTETDR